MALPHCYDGKTHLPIPSGQYVVGCTDIMTGGSTENGSFCRIFYPTKLKDPYEHASRWAKYLPHEMYVEGFTAVGGFRIYFLGKKLISWAFGNSYIPVVEDADPSDERNFPVIIFSHGLKACRTTYSIFCSDMSSHGFIVAAMEHRDGSACLSYNLEREENNKSLVERWIAYKPPSFENGEELAFRQQQLQTRSRECSHTLDLLFKLNEGAQIEHILQPTIDFAMFKGIMDLSAPIMAGHSFGSATLLRTLAADERFKVGLAMDAWLWPLKDDIELAQKITQPVLFINSEAFQTVANLSAMKLFTVDADHTERRVVTLKGSVHYSQNDVPCLLPWYIRRFTYHSAIDPLLAIELNNRISLLYLRKHLGHPVDEELPKLAEEHAHLIVEGIP